MALRKKIGFIGCGNMAEALVAGLIRHRTLPARSLFVYDLKPSRMLYLEKHYRVVATPKLDRLVQKSDVIILAVKPQDVKKVLTALAPLLKKSQLVISIAAGVDTAFFKKHIDAKSKIVRTMPNTPALVGYGTTGLYATPSVNTRDLNIAHQIFQAVGLVIIVRKESVLDAITALSGSGPAFVFYFVEAFIQAGKKLGLPVHRAREIVYATFEGALQLLKQTETSPEILRKKVTSKGGTTAAGLKQMQKDHVAPAIIRMLRIAAQRAVTLRKEL